MRQRLTHEIKTWPREFQETVYGRKLFEIRVNDRDYRVGDLLIQKEWDPEAQKSTGRWLKSIVTYLIPGGQWGLPENLCVLGIRVYDSIGVEDVLARPLALTETRRAEIRRRLANPDLSPGPWRGIAASRIRSCFTDTVVCDVGNSCDADADFIREARTDVSLLLDALDRADGRNVESRP